MNFQKQMQFPSPPVLFCFVCLKLTNGFRYAYSCIRRGDVSDKELEHLVRSQAQKALARNRIPFSLENCSEEECTKSFRFTHPQLELLCTALRFPDYFRADN